MAFKMRTRKYADLEWCGGRMAHLRVKGQYRTLCGADPGSTNMVDKDGWDAFLGPGGYGHRPTLTEAEAKGEHRCKNCVKRVKDYPEAMR